MIQEGIPAKGWVAERETADHVGMMMLLSPFVAVLRKPGYVKTNMAQVLRSPQKDATTETSISHLHESSKN